MKCAWEGCQQEAKTDKKYCPACSKVAFSKFKDMLEANKVAKAQRETDFQRILDAAIQAGNAAHETAKTIPMVVEQRANILNDRSPVVEQYVVEGGVCGFGWVSIAPCNSQFANWLKEKGYTIDGYAKCINLRPRLGSQSMARQEAWAYACSKFLNDNITTLQGTGKTELKIYARSRID